ncbi:LOW QUALITY PROTEIN: zinc finger protein 511-like [Argopecten irradians]|uniref:LOW QUALITY PROTEIN: zinc finger protein 511-like n=1 Tax=Argopecten irradians TaxID=31199 RepID=UPI003711A1E6
MGVPCRWKVCKRRLTMDCSFFEEGNNLCYYPSKHVTSAINIIFRKQDQEFLCQLANCGKTFGSHASYESHYGLVHSRVCQTCRKNFPNNHLLDLHILECHDSMFAVQAEKQPMFQCLVESCNCKFSTRKERKNHVIKFHKYPSNYRFDREQSKQSKSNGGKLSEMEITTFDTMETTVSVTEGVNGPGGPFGAKEAEKMKDTSPPRRQFSYKVPNNICFGQGTSRSFQRTRGRGRGRGNKKHWHNRGMENMDTHVDIENIDLQAMKQALT